MASDLNDFELFSELAPAEFEAIVSAGREKRFSPGERIVGPAISRPEVENSSLTAEACTGCGTEFLLGSRFCHTCGKSRPEAIGSTTRTAAAALSRLLLRLWKRALAELSEGDHVDHVALLLSGLAKVTQMGLNGNEVILRLNGAGEIVCSLGTNRKRKQVLRAQAVLPCVALVWDARVFQELLARIPTFRRNIMRALEKRLSEMEQRCREVSSQEVDSRLWSELVRIANRLHRSTESPLEIPLSRTELAQLIGTTLYTVRRLLARGDEPYGGDDPYSLVPALLKPKPSRNSGAVALPEPSTEQYD